VFGGHPQHELQVEGVQLRQQELGKEEINNNKISISMNTQVFKNQSKMTNAESV